jgi:TPP-dependent pyruvate/acetoin dehydrogenase alpha subunit
MIDKKILSIEEKNVIHKKLEDEIDNAVEFARNDEYPPEDQLTSDVYAE